MRVKTPLLKFRRRGDPHFREFVLSDDMRTLAWYSPSKATADTESTPSARQYHAQRLFTRFGSGAAALRAQGWRRRYAP